MIFFSKIGKAGLKWPEAGRNVQKWHETGCHGLKQADMIKMAKKGTKWSNNMKNIGKWPKMGIKGENMANHGAKKAKTGPKMGNAAEISHGTRKPKRIPCSPILAMHESTIHQTAFK